MPAVADDTVKRYYYIYDSRETRTVVVDRTTGEEFLWEDDPRAPLLAHVVRKRSGRALRHFAVWCAQEVTPEGSGTGESNHPAHELTSATRRLLRVVRHRLNEGDGGASFGDVRRETSDVVVRAATIGLAQMDPEAARLLTVQACTHASPRRAALDAAHMAERYAEFVAFAERDAGGGTGDRPAPDAAARAMRRRQIDALLDGLLQDGE
ncbi:hypothetical protein [Longibacter sp.]|uniref:hypothetical protein n=1 Tax=Longibacter sp. TaxID=2045415 RepID=UPI003EB7D2FA